MADNSAPRLNVITCGTSILTNFLSNKAEKEKEENEFKALKENVRQRERGEFLRDTANKSSAEYSPEEEKLLCWIFDKRLKTLLEANEDSVCRLSAEMNGLISYYRKSGSLNDAKNDMHYLLHSDTYQGELVADLIKDYLNNHGIKAVTLQKINHLRMDKKELFLAGMNELAHWCAETLPGYERSHHIIFNLVGGFKTLQGYMQTLGMFYADESVYIFEGRRELLTIPRLPVDFAESAKKEIKDQLEKFRILSVRELPLDECSSIPESMLSISENKCRLSFFGELLFRVEREKLYNDTLLPFPPGKVNVIYSNKAQTAFDKMTVEQRIRVNKKMDDLYRFLTLDEYAPVPENLSFKLLAGNPKPPSTHEFYLWSDGGAWRALCHYEDGKKKLVFDSLGPHL